MAKITTAQKKLLSKIAESQPVSAIRLGLNYQQRKTLERLYIAGLIEARSKGLFGYNWSLTDKGNVIL